MTPTNDVLEALLVKVIISVFYRNLKDSNGDQGGASDGKRVKEGVLGRSRLGSVKVLEGTRVHSSI